MVVATGFFDGVHLGHRLVLERLVSSAKERGEGSVVVTFWPHPRNVLQDEQLANGTGSSTEKLASIAPVQTTCSRYFSWNGGDLGEWGEPRKKLAR